MKKIFSLVLVIVLAGLLCACGGNTSDDGTISKDVNLYFSNSEYNNLKSEKRTITYGEDESLPRTVLQKLTEGPGDTSSKAVIPSGTQILNFEIVEMTAKINFSGNYLKFEGDNAKSMELLARYSIVKTLCELPGIDRVEIRVENAALTGANGEPVGVLGENDIVLSEGDNVTQKYVTLYFSDEMGEKLVAQRRRATIVDNSMEKTILIELIEGPEGDNQYATLPQGIKVLSVETKEKICFVNFSKEFAENIGGGSSASTMAIYSVVNSLTELPEIEQVQFLIEGEKTEWLGEYDVSEPFRRDESFIE